MKSFLMVVLAFQCAICLGQIDSVSGDSSGVIQPAVPGEQKPLMDEDKSNAEVMIKMQREEVPPFLLNILRDEKYIGWESGGVYRNEQGTVYKVEIMDGMKNATYYFDKEGTLLKAE
jgi:hypothetical protein